MKSDAATDQASRPRLPVTALKIDVQLLQGVDPAVAESLKPELERFIELYLLAEQPHVLERADKLAELLSEKIEPNLGLVRERMQRLATIRKLFQEDEWLTAEQLNTLQPKPPANRSHPASDWKRRGRIFGVNYGGKEYFPRYQFDDAYQPLPVIRAILGKLGPLADPWKIAAWFNFPNGWIARSGKVGPQAMAPKDALDYREAVLNAAAKRRQGTYLA